MKHATEISLDDLFLGDSKISNVHDTSRVVGGTYSSTPKTG